MELLHCVAVSLLFFCTCSPSYGVLVGPPPLPVGRANVTGPPLRVGFYISSCPRAEAIIQAQVQKRFLLDNTITPALLRMLFHDSFVRGADASILLDSTPGHEAEKEALPNLTIRGFDLIEETKAAVEAACPGVVSCADILVLAVRDSVVLAGGPKYDVPTGRLDGLVSSKEEALNLPSPAFPVEQAAESFRQKGLDLEDMVVLLGAHTVGVALCGFFNDRLFNFHGTGMPDPTMSPQLVTRLATVCPNPFFTESNADPPIDLDQSTPAVFDATYYTQILQGNGILQIDQEITDDPSTVGLVHSLTSAAAFFPAFVKSIVKMGNIEVITGSSVHGEIRRKCNVVNGGAVPVAKPGPPAATPGVVHSPPPGVPPAKPPVGTVTKPAPPGPVSKPPAAAKPGPPVPVSKPPGAAKPAPPVQVSKPPGAAKPAPPVQVSKPPVAAKPTPPGHVGTPPPARGKPPAAGPASKPPAPSRSTPAGHVIKPPVVSKPTPAPGSQGRTPPATSKPTPAAPARKPGPAAPRTPPAGQVRTPPASSKPKPVAHKLPPPSPRPTAPASKPSPRGQIRRAPRGPSGQVTPARKPTPARGGGSRKSPIPGPPFGHAGKAPAVTRPITKPPAVTRPITKPPATPARKPTPARGGGKSPIPAPPFRQGSKSPLTPASHGRSRKGPPVGHVSRPARPPLL